MQININLYLQIFPSKQKVHLDPSYVRRQVLNARLDIFHSSTTNLKINKFCKNY
jgi:hypothetical protein